MKRQHCECLSSVLTRRSARLLVLSLAVVAMTLGVSVGSGHATTVWFDDFSDGNAEDGNPETWVPHPAPALQGDYNATSGDYIFTPGFGAGNQDAMVASIEGDLNGLDVDPFVAAVLGGSYDAPADMNGDGAVDGLDVDPFVAAVVGGAQSIPEPSTLLLTLIALAVVGGWRKWGG